MDSTRPDRPRWPGRVARVALALGLLALAVRSNRTALAEVLGRRPDLSLLSAAFGLYLAGLVLSFGRWWALVRAGGLPLRPRDALRLGFIGALFNFVLPGAIVGIFVRAAFLCREHPERKGPAIASSFLDLVLGLLGLALWACLSGVRSWPTLGPPARRMVVVAFVLAAAFSGLLLAAFGPGMRRRIERRQSGKKRPSRLLAELIATGSTYGCRIYVLPAGILLGMATHGLYVVAFMAAGRALFGAVPSAGEHFLIVPLVLFSTAIPLPFGALGATEQVSTYLFRHAGYPGGGVAMMTFRALQVGGALIGLGVYLANLAQARSLRAEAESLVSAAPLPPEVGTPVAR